MAGSGQRMDKEKSGGMRIDDHAFFAGKGSPTFPKGVHTKDESSAEGAGEVMKYEDTSAAIKAGQVEGTKKVKQHPMKQPNYRN